MISIQDRFYNLQKLPNKKLLIDICKKNNYKCCSSYCNLKIIHNILKNEYALDIYNDFINFIDIDYDEYKSKIKLLEKKNKIDLQNILENYNLPKTGIKQNLVQRIITYEYFKKILLNSEQNYNNKFKNDNRLLYTPLLNYTKGYNSLYNHTNIYSPHNFYNLTEYVKHLENLRHIDNYVLITQNFELLNQEWFNLIQTILQDLGWTFSNFETTLEETVNNKYTNNNENQVIIDKNKTFKFESNEKMNCIICMEQIKKNDICKKLNNCEHVFHNECVNEWLLKVLECPICRKSIDV